jgi:murein DD-endopeptidase MepM/ murein hydrolase activator NlpD
MNRFLLKMLLIQALSILMLIESGLAIGGNLKWPIDCIPQKTCNGSIGYPDIDSNGVAFNCSKPGYTGHQGTDIGAPKGTAVYAALDGEVQWIFDGKYDNCPSTHADCQAPTNGFVPNQSSGYRVCTDVGPYCGTGTGNCFWCFDGGNVIVIKHQGDSRVFATRYDHLKTHSILVAVGDKVKKGQKIAEVGSAGHSTGTHLHFEVWGTGFYELAEPWAGTCGPNFNTPLWENGNFPWLVGTDKSPDKFIFTPQSNVELSSMVNSNVVTITGIDALTPITIVGGEYSINGGIYNALQRSLQNGDKIQVRHLSSNKSKGSVTTSVKVGDVSVTFKSTTRIVDATPDRFTFVTQSNLKLSTLIESNTVIITGINTLTPVAVTAGEYRINNGIYRSSEGMLQNGDKVQVRHLSSSLPGKSIITTLNINGIKGGFKTTTSR